MPYAITIVPVVPMRAEPSHRSENVSQLLFGECVETDTVTPDGWVKVKAQFDGYEGWITQSHITMIDNELYDSPYTHYAKNWVNEIMLNGKPMHIPYGCLLKLGKDVGAIWGNVSVSWGNTVEKLPHPLGTGATPSIHPTHKTITDTAHLFLNTAYLWGGKSVFGIDCSGFTQSVFKLLGMPLLRDAYQQASQGEQVGFLVEAKLGDLAFFDNEAGKITHVGILLNDHEIIHAAGKVRVDAIDNQGIINVDTGVRTHKLRLIKRFF
ncbi:SH3 domain-containing protein [Chitinophaga skermanii]|uniref:SH3 domain-containing protein n=1 Tax=Chitinophaga skermanii TaxID=331697 RepID=A0A327QRA9_9BACT|nr:C40 family peptidase [Chitinophaga skermanii]RAJ06860.1 SH3 domain-containing protein [Chitinophaga skermanii]